MDSDGEVLSNLSQSRTPALTLFMQFYNLLFCIVFIVLFFVFEPHLTPTRPPHPHPCGRDIHRLPSPRAVHVCTVCMCLLLLLFLRGARKSGKFLAQLVPAVSIPRVHVCP